MGMEGELVNVVLLEVNLLVLKIILVVVVLVISLETWCRGKKFILIILSQKSNFE